MRSNLYTNEKNNPSNREKHLQDGTLLSAYQYRLPIQKFGREKMLVRSNFSSFLSVHNCFYCKQVYVPLNIARIAHFRAHVFDKGQYEYSNTLSNKTELLQQELHLLFD